MPCPSVPKESCWPPNVLPAPQTTHPGLSQAAVVPLLASSHIFHDCDPFCLCGVEICSQGGGTKAGRFKPPCCGLRGVSGDVFGGAAFLFSPVGMHVVPQTIGQSKPTAGVGSNRPAPHATDPGELRYRKEAAV